MINWNTILSSFNDKGTLLQFLETLEAALENGSLSDVEIVDQTSSSVKLKFKFADGTYLTTSAIALAQGPTGPTGPAGADGEDGQSVETVTASVDSNTGTPSVDVDYDETTGALDLDFHNLKGAGGDSVQTVTASVDNQTGTPSVDVTWTASTGLLDFDFHNLKGNPGSATANPITDIDLSTSGTVVDYDTTDGIQYDATGTITYQDSSTDSIDVNFDLPIKAADSSISMDASSTNDWIEIKVDSSLQTKINAAYSPSNIPPYPVTSINGDTGAVTLDKSDVGLGNVDNVQQYSASNPPPYPVTSVGGSTGAVTLKTVNSESLIGSGDITISGGSSAYNHVNVGTTIATGLYYSNDALLGTAQANTDYSMATSIGGNSVNGLISITLAGQDTSYANEWRIILKTASTLSYSNISISVPSGYTLVWANGDTLSAEADTLYELSFILGQGVNYVIGSYNKVDIS